jgi:hypothetical protein
MISKTTSAVLALVLIFLTSSCKDSKMPTTVKPVKLAALLPDDFIRRLSRQTIYFGHQSVGYNILDGIRDIAREYPPLELNVVETTDLATVGTPVFAHSRIGRNGQPLSKLDGFSTVLRRNDTTRADVAFMKFCYVDFTEQTDIQGVFGRYVETFAELKLAFPDTTFVHMTVPLTGRPRGVDIQAKNLVKRLLGRRVASYKDNMQMTRFNDLLRAKYLGKEPVFDLASIESTHADGTRVVNREAGMSVYSLAPEYTFDGGHLNERGRRIVALELLRVLAALPEKAPPK